MEARQGMFSLKGAENTTANIALIPKKDKLASTLDKLRQHCLNPQEGWSRTNLRF
jgi:hypothetical protein